MTVLGHIFEQSITDIERKRAEARGEAAPKVSARKRTGVVYTPDMVTRFLVEQTIGRTLDERRAELRAQHRVSEGDVPPDKEVAFWRAWLDALRNLRSSIPLAALAPSSLRRSTVWLRNTGRCWRGSTPSGRQPASTPSTNRDQNLHGVDLDPESVEITRLSLWLKTARRDHRLQNLEATIRVGDSLIEDPAFTSRPFDWRAAFPKVFERGGFDVVIGVSTLYAVL